MRCRSFCISASFAMVSLFSIPTVAALTITSVPEKAVVTEDTLLLGETSLTIRDVATKVHKLTLSKPGFRDTTIAIVGTPQMENSINVVMTPGLAQTEKKEAHKNGDGYYSIKGVMVAHDFTQFRIEQVPVRLGMSAYKLSRAPRYRMQNDACLYFGHTNDRVNKGIQIFVNYPCRDTFKTKAYGKIVYAPMTLDDSIQHIQDSIALANGVPTAILGNSDSEYHVEPFSKGDTIDTVHVTTVTFGGGIMMNVLYSVAQVRDIFQLDLGMVWGLYSKVQLFKYESREDNGGIGKYQLRTLENGDDPKAPVKGFATLGGAEARLLAGYKHVFLIAGYQFLPAIKFDGLSDKFPDNSVSFLPLQKVMVGIVGRY